MSETILKVGKKEYVVVPKRRYEQLLRIRRNAMDTEIAQKSIQDSESRKLKAISLRDARARRDV